MSDYTLDNREEVVRLLTEQVLSNAPIRELLRVYQEAVTAAIENLSDAELVRSVSAAGYTSILEAFELEVPDSETEVA